MRAYLVEKEQASGLGEIVTVTSEQVGHVGFFPTEKNPTGATVHGGDLVVIDECWRWWGRGVQVPVEHVEFFRFHRHFTNDAGTSCDLVIVTQDIQAVQGDLRRLIESYYVFRKQKALGWSKGYYYELRQGYTVKADVIREGLRTYDKTFFPFYSSYAGKGGDERDVDGRLNIFRGGFLRWGAAIAAFFLVGGAYGVYRFFSSGFGSGTPSADVASEKKAGVLQRTTNFGAVDPNQKSTLSFPDLDGGGYRYAGEITVRGERYAIVEREGRLRFILVRGYVERFPAPVVYVDGVRVDATTGGGRGRGILGAGIKRGG
jgi:zona occludens toxin